MRLFTLQGFKAPNLDYARFWLMPKPNQSGEFVLKLGSFNNYAQMSS